MTEAKIHSGDTTDFEHVIRDQNDEVVDISSATTLTLNFIKPDGTVFSRTALLVSGGLDGKMHYTALVTDLDVQGDWARQTYVKTSVGEWTGKLFQFTVFRKLA